MLELIQSGGSKARVFIHLQQEVPGEGVPSVSCKPQLVSLFCQHIGASSQERSEDGSQGWLLG